MNIQLTLARRYLAGRKLRTFLTTLAIVFAVVVIFGMNMLLPAFVRAFQANTLAAAGEVDATITLKTGDVFDAALIDEVATVDGVLVASGFLNRAVNLPADYLDGDPAAPDAITALAVTGIEVEQATAIHTYLLREGRFLERGDTDATVITETLAEAIVRGVGDSLTVPTAVGETSLTIVGILPPRLMPGNEELLVSLPQAQAMLDMPGRVNTIEANFDTLDEADRATIRAEILAVLGDAFQLGALESNSELLANLQIAQGIFSLLGVLALLMGAFIIFNTFRTIVAERRRDIGMLRALGADRRIIFGIILSEGLLQGLIGTAVGMLFGYVLGYGLLVLLSPIVMRFVNAEIGPPVVSSGLVVVTIAVGVGMTLLAGLLPALTASKVTPLEVLRPSVGALSLRRLAGIGFWAGITMIALAIIALLTRQIAFIALGGVLFVMGLILGAPALVTPISRLFGALLAVVFARSGTAQLAEGNLTRQPSRAAITASTTLIGMAILIMAASIISSVYLGFGNIMRKSLGSDFLIVPPSIGVWGTNIGASQELADELQTIDGVAVVSSLRFAPATVGDAAVSLLGIDPATYPAVSGLTFAQGDERAYDDLASGRNVIINPVLAAISGADVGDDIELLTPTGPQNYRVAAVGGDYLNAKINTAYISQANIAADFGREEDVLLHLNVASGTDAAVVESKLKASLRTYPQFRLIDGEEFIAENMTIFEAAFSGLFGLVLFLAVPSLIAMLNTLAIGVIERTREIGMLRAVGATRGQVRNVILAEAITLAALGTAFGILSGLYLGYMAVEAMKTAGYPMEYVFPTAGVFIAVAAGLLFGVLAAIIPARQAARLEIVRALRYE